MLSVAALREEGVYLIHEDDSRLVAPCHGKQSSHHLLTLSYLRESDRTHGKRKKEVRKRGTQGMQKERW